MESVGENAESLYKYICNGTENLARPPQAVGGGLAHACTPRKRARTQYYPFTKNSETWRQPLAGSATADWLAVHARP